MYIYIYLVYFLYTHIYIYKMFLFVYIYIYVFLYIYIYIFDFFVYIYTNELLVGFLFEGFNSHWITSLIHFQPSVISMMAPTWCHGPIWGYPFPETLNERTSEFIHFNLVIRLSEGKQLALFRFSPGRPTCWTACRGTGQSPFLILPWRWQPWKLPFSNDAQATDICTWLCKAIGAWLFPSMSSTLVSGEAKTVVHLIREESRSRYYMPTCGLTDYSPVMGTPRGICILELNPFFFFVTPLVPNFFP